MCGISGWIDPKGGVGEAAGRSTFQKIPGAPDLQGPGLHIPVGDPMPPTGTRSIYRDVARATLPLCVGLTPIAWTWDVPPTPSPNVLSKKTAIWLRCT